MLDFDALARDLLADALGFVSNLFPDGKQRGPEWCIGSLAGEPGASLKINLKSGVWKDFASGEGGADLISLYAAKHGIGQKPAAEELGARALRSNGAGPHTRPVIAAVPTEPVFERPPTGCKKPTMLHPAYGRPVAAWVYRDSVGPFQIKARYEPEGERKQIVPWTWAAAPQRWEMRGIKAPRPLYGLDQLALRPGVPVLLVEGEKACEAARLLCPRYVCMTWDGGTQSVRQAHWKALDGRDVLIWPDADAPGIDAVYSLYERLLGGSIASRVRWIDPEGQPEGWDAADAVAEGWDTATFKAWAKPRLKDVPRLSKLNVKSSSTTTNGTQDDKSELQLRQAAQTWAEKLPGLPRDLYAGLAQAYATHAPAAQEGQLQELCRRVSQEGLTYETAVQALWGPELANAPPELRSAIERGMDVQEMPSSASRVGGVRLERSPAATLAPVETDGPTESNGGAPPTDDSAAPAPVEEKPKPKRRQRLLTAPNPPEETESSQSVAALWNQYGMKLKGNGEPYLNMDNVLRVLESSPKWKQYLWFDSFHNKIMRFSDDNPWGRQPWEDGDTLALLLYFQRSLGLSDLRLERCREAVRMMAFRNRRNELTDWLDSLSWDGTARLEHFLTEAFGCRHDEYTMAVGRCWLVSLVARAYDPGCKVDTVPILEGRQGAFKGTALEILGGAWYLECHEKISDKDFYQVIQGAWVIEIAEMHSFHGRQLEHVKGVITCRNDRFRASYAEFVAEHPRQGVFSGTTNKDDWNADDTGARRFWPIRCLDTNTDWLREQREQLFAEAVALYRRVPVDAPAAARIAAGAGWWDVPLELAESEQEARKTGHPWEELIYKFIHFERVPVSAWDGIPGAREGEEFRDVEREAPREGFTVNEILTTVIDMEPSRRTRNHEMEVSNILKSFFMVKRKVGKVWRYYRS